MIRPYPAGTIYLVNIYAQPMSGAVAPSTDRTRLLHSLGHS